VSTDWIGNIFSRWFSFWGREGYENREKMRRSACRCRREKTTLTNPQNPYRQKKNINCSRVYWWFNAQSSKEAEITHATAAKWLLFSSYEVTH
jgi:hypothetical protein